MKVQERLKNLQRFIQTSKKKPTYIVLGIIDEELQSILLELEPTFKKYKRSKRK